MKRIFVVDSYDSFTYNLVHILRELGMSKRLEITRNDQFELDELAPYSHILLSPGPGIPRDAGNMMKVIERYAATKNLLGVCLGHQGIAEAFGGRLFNLPQVLHGVTTPIEVVAEDALFKGIPARFNACRYHSWSVARDTLPSELEITSVDEEGLITSFRHRQYKVRGVQFHPESMMTKHGKKMIKNWLSS